MNLSFGTTCKLRGLENVIKISFMASLFDIIFIQIVGKRFRSTYLVFRCDVAQSCYHHVSTKPPQKTNYDTLLDKAGVCGLANRRIKNMMICIFKCLHFGKYPCYLKQLIKLRSTAYSLRGTNILSLPKPSTTTYGLNSFSYSSVKYWNSLPDHFRKTVDYSEFKRKLLVHSFS